MNWEYRLVPSTTSELDSATFSGIKFFKTLRDENNNEIANFETTALDFTENASQSVKTAISRYVERFLVYIWLIA